MVGFELIISAPLHKKDALQEALRLTKNRNVDGVILYPSNGIDQIIKEFRAKNLRYVTLGICYDQQKNNFVEVDQTPGCYLATKYLLSLGHRRIGLLNKPYSFFMFSRDDLLNGYVRALHEAGIEYLPSLVREGNFTFEDGYEKFRSLKEEHPDLTAVICASDPMTYGTIRAIADMGLKTDEIQVVAGDNLPLTQKLFPQLSSITNPSYEQGKQAGKMIVNIINEGTEIPGVTLNTEFVVRNMQAINHRENIIV
jgi:DNA-binding LacI/PurR family transcriptional regulator